MNNYHYKYYQNGKLKLKDHNFDRRTILEASEHILKGYILMFPPFNSAKDDNEIFNAFKVAGIAIHNPYRLLTHCILLNSNFPKIQNSLIDYFNIGWDKIRYESQENNYTVNHFDLQNQINKIIEFCDKEITINSNEAFKTDVFINYHSGNHIKCVGQDFKITSRNGEDITPTVLSITLDIND